MTRPVIVVRGAGDLATGTLLRLVRCGFRVVALECAQPSAIRRKAAFCEAVYDGWQQVEGLNCCRVATVQECAAVWERGELPLLVDETAACAAGLCPAAVVDAILAKRNCGTHRGMAPVTVGLGPGFTAGQDVDAVIETQRGHNLGRVFYEGAAQPNTGVPGVIAGFAAERVIHAPAAGAIVHCSAIGDPVESGQVLAQIEGTPVHATITGVLRGLIREGYPVTTGLKIADIDPRVSEQKNCYTVSDKARCIAGGVVEALLFLAEKKGVRVL